MPGRILVCAYIILLIWSNFNLLHSSLCITYPTQSCLVLFTLHWEFLSQRLRLFFLWSLSDSKSLQISRTLLSILAVLNNTLIWMVSTRPLIFKFPRPITKPLGIVPSAPVTIDITVTFSCSIVVFSSRARSNYLSLISFSFNFISVVRLDGKIHYSADSLFFSSFFFLFFMDSD